MHSILRAATAGLVALGLLQDPSPTPVGDALTRMLGKEVEQKAGLHKLGKDERAKLAVELERWRRRTKDPGVEAAMRYLQAQGWTLRHAGIGQLEAEDTVWVEDRFGNAFHTTDIPFNLPKFRMNAQSYWCKEELLGGVSKLLVDGKEYSFRLATWIKEEG